MTQTKLTAGQIFPSIEVQKLTGGILDLAAIPDAFEWRMVVVYRGKHCPLCTRYLTTLNDLLADFNDLGVDVVAISADPLEKAQVQIKETGAQFEVGYDLSIEQMRTLGLYISNPRSDAETDRPFSEAGVFVINDKGQLQIIDISNAPFARPDPNSLLAGLKFIRNPDNNYPIRGTHS